MTKTFEDIWDASIAAVQALGPVTIRIVCEAEKLPSSEDRADSATPERWTTEVQQSLDTPGGRARIDIQESLGTSQTIVVVGKERTTVRREGFISVARDIALEEPDGMPLPLWTDASAAALGYAHLLDEPEPADDEAGDGEPDDTDASRSGRIERGPAEQLPDGGWSLSWTRSEEREEAAFTLLLGENLLPVSLTQESRIDAHGVEAVFLFVTEYRFEDVPSLPDSVFVVGLPAEAQIHTVSRRLPVGATSREEADWGHYWLGEQVGQWSLTDARHDTHKTRSAPTAGTESLDEFILLLYQQPDGGDPSERVHVYVRPLRDPGLEEHLEFVEMQVATAGWERRDAEVAGKSAIVYSGSLSDGFDETGRLMYVFMPDALVVIQPSPGFDLDAALGSLRPVA